MATCKRMKMMSLLFLFLHIVIVFGNEHVPVLLWEAKGTANKQVPELPSLSKISSEEFSDYFAKVVSRKTAPQPLIAVFVEENLSVEDFSWQDSEGHIGFPHLENLTSSAKRVDFFPSVHAPLKGLKRLGYRWQTRQVEDQEYDLSVPSEGGLVFVVKLGEAKVDEDRPDFLNRHDNVISEIYNDLLAKNKDVIALYTSHHSSWVEPEYEPLVRRVRSTDLDENYVFWNDSDIYFYASVPPVFSHVGPEDKTINITKPSCKKDTRPQTQTFSLRCKFDNNNYVLEFKFAEPEPGYWNLTINIMTNNTVTQLSTSTDIYAPFRFSYHCSQNVVFKNGGMSLTLRNFQIQPNVTNGAFDDAYDCVWFFTVPIWAGLMITVLLGAILMVGLAAIIDINTMDRFDDPKGKPITINVSE